MVAVDRLSTSDVAEARYEAYCDRVEAERVAAMEAMLAASEVYLRALEADCAALRRSCAARTRLETYRHGGALAPADVVAVLHAAGVPDETYKVEPVVSVVPIPHQVCVWCLIPATLEGTAAVLESAGYMAHRGVFKRGRPGLDVVRGKGLATRTRVARGLTPPVVPDGEDSVG